MLDNVNLMKTKVWLSKKLIYNERAIYFTNITNTYSDNNSSYNKWINCEIDKNNNLIFQYNTFSSFEGNNFKTWIDVATDIWNNDISQFLR